ncbi:MAG TPA: endonuclease/exonuclease/phosphatase family protein [Chitinophagaceae bacterium]|nr:endonuclease/exonuclease/phosphatase family protein [Chitinophagaceae bacterium]
MGFSARLLLHRLLLMLTLLAALPYVMAALVPYLGKAAHRVPDWLVVFFPVTGTLLLLLGLVWLAIRPRRALWVGLILLTGWKTAGVLVALPPARGFGATRPPGSLRVVTWNVARFQELRRNDNAGSRVRQAMMDLLRRQDADLVCLQEFFSSRNPAYYDNLDYIRRELRYPYFYFSYDEDGHDMYYSSVIFSRLPILDTTKIYFPRPGLPEALLRADIAWGADTLSVFTTHLQSVQFRPDDYTRLDEIREGRDSLIQHSRSLLGKLGRAGALRAGQADLVKRALAASPHPVLFCGDLNDVPGSYTYFTVRGDLRDAFLEGGSGLGRSFSGISPTLRIDYIFHDRRLRVVQFNRVVKILSDHYLQAADLVRVRQEP